MRKITTENWTKNGKVIRNQKKNGEFLILMNATDRQITKIKRNQDILSVRF